MHTSNPVHPQGNGKVDRFQRIDQLEFYQLLTNKHDINLNAKLAEGEAFNISSPHGAFDGRAPYEILREKL